MLNDQIVPESVELEDCIEGMEGIVRPLDDCCDSEELFPGQHTGRSPDADPPPVVTQENDNVDDALHFDDPEDVLAAADVINNIFCHLRDAYGAPSSTSCRTEVLQSQLWSWNYCGPTG
jgi:hypothetical protein